MPKYWKEKNSDTDFYDVKGVVDCLLNYLAIKNVVFIPANEPYYLPNTGFIVRQSHATQTLGTVGKLDKKVLKSFDIDVDVFCFDLNLDQMLAVADFSVKKYKEISKYPTVKRDLSFIVSNEYLIKDIIKTIFEINPKIVRDVIPFDQFKGKQISEGFRSLSINISLNSANSTLTDEQIKKIMSQIIERLCERYKIEMR